MELRWLRRAGRNGVSRTVAGLMVACAACSSGSTPSPGSGSQDDGGSGSSSGAATDSGGSSYAQYDTLMGTFSSTTGIQATFSGAVEIQYRAQDSGWTLGGYGSFGESGQGTPAVTISSPSGATAKLSFTVTGTGAPAAAMTSGDCNTSGFTIIMTVTGGGSAGGVYDTELGYPGNTCKLTLDTPANVIPDGAGTGGSYFAHGSLDATISVSPSDVGTFSATW
jgi:hypothetical protein